MLTEVRWSEAALCCDRSCQWRFNSSTARLYRAQTSGYIAIRREARIEGLAVENFFGYSSQAGDVNGDGFDDIMASSFVAEGGNTGYIVFGRDYGYGASLVGSGYADLLTGTNGADRLLGGRGDDVIDGGAGNDVLALPDHASAFLTNSKLQVLVDGDAGDSVISPGQGWINGADINVGGTVYSSYTQMGNAAMLLLDAAMTQTIS